MKYLTWATKKAQSSKGQCRNVREVFSNNVWLAEIESLQLADVMRNTRLNGQRYFATLKGYLASIRKELKRDAKRKKVSAAQLLYHLRSRFAAEEEPFRIAATEQTELLSLLLRSILHIFLTAQTVVTAAISLTWSKLLEPCIELVRERHPQIQTTCAPNV